MKIEVGKFYKTRDARKVRIYAIDGGDGDPVHGAQFHDKEWLAYQWDDDGNFVTDRDDDNDIVSEWEDPKPRLLGWITFDGALRFNSDPKMNSDKSGHERWKRAPWLDEPEEK